MCDIEGSALESHSLSVNTVLSMQSLKKIYVLTLKILGLSELGMLYKIKPVLFAGFEYTVCT